MTIFLYYVWLSPAVTWGRQTWDEVKKDGKARFMFHGMRKYCFAERAGVRLIEMEADFASNLPEATKHSSGMTFNLRLSLVCKGLVYRLI